MAEKTDDLLPEERKFAEEVQRLRKLRGWNQTQMADHLVEQGVVYMTQSTVSRIEKLQRPVRVGEAEAWAFVFDTSVFRLMHPLVVDEVIESTRWNYNRLSRAWADLDAAMRKYALVRGDLEGTVAELNEDAADPEIDNERKWELSTLAQGLSNFPGLEKAIHDRLSKYILIEVADGKHPTAS